MLYTSTTRSSFWTRSSPDGRFVGRGTHLYDLSRNAEITTTGAQYDPAFGTPGQIGELLLTKFLLPFEVASFLLLIAAVGAVVLARRRGGIVDQAPATPLDRPRPLGTGTMAEAVGILLPEGSGLKEDEPERDKGGW